MEEIWKDISGYEKLYQISSFGRVKSLKYGKEKILKPGKNIDGYLLVVLYKEGNKKTFTVHRLVANSFIQNQNNLQEVNHKDENPKNNYASNLEWCDRKYNVNYGTLIKRMRKTLTNHHSFSKKVICVETNKVYPSSMEAERQTGISHSHISNCCNGKRKTSGGYHWKYYN